MEQELKEQVNQILQKNLDEVYFSVAEKILNDHPKSRYLPWMLAHKMSPEEARVIDALPDKDWTPEVGELKVSKSFAEKLGMDFFIRCRLAHYLRSTLAARNDCCADK